MVIHSSISDVRKIGALLRGEPGCIDSWVRLPRVQNLTVHLVWIVVGMGCYGAAMGAWRDSLQALYTAIKFPLIILLTTFGNGLINSMLAPLLGLNISFRQCMFAILTSCSLSAAILGAFSPLMAFMVWNATPLSAAAPVGSDLTHDAILLTHVLVIAFAGIVANLRLSQWLTHLGGSPVITQRVLSAWLIGNLFLGSQLSWIFRPFVGLPGLPVEFIRPSALHGSFYETVFQLCVNVFVHGHGQ
jgi:hypothetical protein